MRTAASATGKVVETLGSHFVRVLGETAKPARTSWAQIATPSGRVGFVGPGLLLSLACERLCYGKDVTGRWRIAGFVGAGD
jgi:hypothetical protein